MSLAVDKYLNRIMAVADIEDGNRRQEVRDEIEDHLLQKIDELQKKV